MNKTKQTFIFGFAIFAGFFGAGNLVLPPLLGFNSGPDWWLVATGFILSATILPLLALFGHAKLQGTMLDFANKVSPLFSLIFCLSIYIIAITLPCPRTAAVTHELAIAPFFGTSPLLTSSIYFGLAFFFVMNRNNVLDILGKYLTPFIVLILLLIICIGLFSPSTEMNPTDFDSPFVSGFLEGYQTYDAMAGLLMGAVVVISLNNLKGNLSPPEKKVMLAKSSGIAMLALFIIYIGLIALGANYNTEFVKGISRSELLLGITTNTLGNIGSAFLGVLVGLACFSTAVSIIVGTADFFKGLFKESQRVYLITAIVSCILGVVVGQFDVHYIINVAVPALMLMYPIMIVLILLNIVPNTFASKMVFRSVVLITFIFSIPDFLGFLINPEYLKDINDIIPFAKHNLGWVLPALLTFLVINLFYKNKAQNENTV